jgi:uncharacterized protein YoxC
MAEKDDWLDELAEVREQEGEEYDAGSEHPAETEEEVAAEPEQAEPAEPEPAEQTVPLATMLETRNKLQARIDGLEGNNKDLLEKFTLLSEKIAQREEKAAQVPEPDYLDDPKAYIDHSKQSLAEKLRSVEEQVAAANEKTQEASEAITQQQQVQAIQSAAGAMEAKFAEGHEDYWNALAHIREVRSTQLKMAFPEASDAQITEHLAGEEFATAAQLIQQNRNPAEYAYEYAKTIGYTASTATTSQTTDEDIETKKELAQGLGGSGEDQGPDVGALADMDMPEFHQAMKEMFG